MARHKIIDESIRPIISEGPGKVTNITVGAGLDSRPCRFMGGLWWEFDDSSVIDVKNAVLPMSECPNRTDTVATSVDGDGLADQFAAVSQAGPVILVIEGRFLYLDEDVVPRIVQALRNVLRNALPICDLMSKLFLSGPAHPCAMAADAIGAPCRFRLTRPGCFIEELGWPAVSRYFVVTGSVEYGIPILLSFVGWLWWPVLDRGNIVWRYSTQTSAGRDYVN